MNKQQLSYQTTDRRISTDTAGLAVQLPSQLGDSKSGTKSIGARARAVNRLGAAGPSACQSESMMRHKSARGSEETLINFDGSPRPASAIRPSPEQASPRSSKQASTSDSMSLNFGQSLMAGVATLKVQIDQKLEVALLPDGDQWDLRGRWDRIKWGHYEALADGIAHTIAVQLKLQPKDVRTNGSILVGDGVAEPRLIVEVPIEHKQAVATDKVWAAIQYVTDLVRGTVALEGNAGSPDFRAQAVAANDPVADRQDVDPTEHPANSGDPVGADSCVAIAASDDLFDAATRRRLQSVARKVLSKVGGSTLDVPCSIQVEGLTRPPLEVYGRCADKPVRPSTGPKHDTFDCYVDGFIRSRHTVYLIDVAGNGLAREVAMASEWERRVAVFASSRYRGRKFQATVLVERKGEKVTRELLGLVISTPPLMQLGGSNDS